MTIWEDGLSAFLTIPDLQVAGRRVLVRSDLNVPLQEGLVADDFRLRAALPTLTQLHQAGAKVIVASHLGRPSGQVDERLRLAPVASRLAQLSDLPVAVSRDLVGEDTHRLLETSSPDEVVLLENTRFHAGETSNDPGLIAELAELADCFVMDAFATAHRAHASTAGVAGRLPSAAGPLVVSEMEAFHTLADDPPRPFVVVLGGAKVADKLPLMRVLLPKVDTLLVGGGMCFSLLASEGYEIGRSLMAQDLLDDLRDLLRSDFGDRIVLPVDVVVAQEFSAKAPHRTVSIKEMDGQDVGLDIGEKTAGLFASTIAGAGSVFWNGPMGVFEWEQYRTGTEKVARAVAETPAYTVVGGGDSAAALREFGLENQVAHLSTGGGAALALLEGRDLPAITALEKWV